MAADQNLVDEATVRQVGLLARLELSEAEVLEYRSSLNNILGYVKALDGLDTSDVEPTSHSIRMANVFREDIPRPSLSAAQATANAPEAEDDCFRVPAVLQDN